MYKNRLLKLRTILRQKNIDGLLVSNFYNIVYLTGFSTLTVSEREAFVLVTRKSLYLFADGRYLNNKKNVIIDYCAKQLTPDKNLISHLSDILHEEHMHTIGFEAEDMRYSEYRTLKEKLPSLKLIPQEKIIIMIRSVKEPDEIETLKKACTITDQCLKQLIPYIKPGVTEKNLAYILERIIRENGCDTAFFPIIAFGPNSSVPHYNTKEGNDAILSKQSCILIDMGVLYRRYCSDVTRMFFIGTPSSELINTYDTLLRVQKKTIQKIKDEKNPRAVDALCCTELATLGFPSSPHSTGHGIGLEIHEYPKISPHSKDILQNNHVFTIEPAIYYPGHFGMRIEDSLAVLNNKPIVLTHFPKQLLIV